MPGDGDLMVDTAMVTTLYLIRHGATEGDGALRYKGSIDVPLSARGAEQVERTSRYIRRHLGNVASSAYRSYLRDIHGKTVEGISEHDSGSLQAVYTSDLSRAVKSAEIIAEPYDLMPIVVADLRERHFGVWEDMTFQEIKERFPQEFEAWAENPLKYSPPEGESTVGVSCRVLAVLESILKKHRGGAISMVSHGGVNRVILCHLLGMPLENIFRIEQDHAAVNIIEFWDAYPVVKLMNGRCESE